MKGPSVKAERRINATVANPRSAQGISILIAASNKHPAEEEIHLQPARDDNAMRLAPLRARTAA
jgi:hypothetical protein